MLLALIFLFQCAGVLGQKIVIKEYTLVLTNVKSCQDSNIIKYTRDQKKVSIQLLDCMGKMKVTVYKGGRLIERGEYANSLDTLKTYVIKNEIGSDFKKIVVEEYFQPLRHGQWSFYNSKGSLIRTTKYEYGIELKE